MATNMAKEKKVNKKPIKPSQQTSSSARSGHRSSAANPVFNPITGTSTPTSVNTNPRKRKTSNTSSLFHASCVQENDDVDHKKDVTPIKIQSSGDAAPCSSSTRLTPKKPPAGDSKDTVNSIAAEKASIHDGKKTSSAKKISITPSTTITKAKSCIKAQPSTKVKSSSPIEKAKSSAGLPKTNNNPNTTFNVKENLTGATSKPDNIENPITDYDDWGDYEDKHTRLSPVGKSNGSKSPPQTSTVPGSQNKEDKYCPSPIASSEVNLEVKTPAGIRRTVMSPISGSLIPNRLYRKSVSITQPLHSPNAGDSPKSNVNLKVNLNVGVNFGSRKSSKNIFGSETGTESPISDDQEAWHERTHYYCNEDQSSNSKGIQQQQFFDGSSAAITVAVRLRPFTAKECYSKSVIHIDDNRFIKLVNSPNELYNKLVFQFDQCFNSLDSLNHNFADQRIVYKRLGVNLLDHALEGYNVCLFAYGQTGSGKSYSMMGTDSEPGIIPRFGQDLFSRLGKLNAEVTVEVSYYEIYKEKIHDLLTENFSNSVDKTALKVREHPNMGPYVVNLSNHIINSFDDLIFWLNLGNKRRATAGTAINERSSRSHSICTLNILQRTKIESLAAINGEIEPDDFHLVTSKVNLVDLAGSERAHVAQSTGERLKEGALINKSLLTLGKVISQLAERGNNSSASSNFIPYRDSILTWLLKESLGGNSRTCMLATISPSNSHIDETISTLRYAAQARRIVNVVRINEDRKSKKIRELLGEIAELKRQKKEISKNSVAVNTESFYFNDKKEKEDEDEWKENDVAATTNNNDNFGWGDIIPEEKEDTESDRIHNENETSDKTFIIEKKSNDLQNYMNLKKELLSERQTELIQQIKDVATSLPQSIETELVANQNLELIITLKSLFEDYLNASYDQDNIAQDRIRWSFYKSS